MGGRKLPPVSKLIEWADKGMTHDEIVERAYQANGERVTRAAVSNALRRAGYEPRRTRYSDELPWTVHASHQTGHAPRMLRFLARRRRWKTDSNVRKLDDEEGRQLDEWLEWLRANDAVVAYCPEYKANKPGFYYVIRDEVTDGPPSLPVRSRPLKWDEIPNDDPVLNE